MDYSKYYFFLFLSINFLFSSLKSMNPQCLENQSKSSRSQMLKSADIGLFLGMTTKYFTAKYLFTNINSSVSLIKKNFTTSNFLSFLVICFEKMVI